MSTPIHKTAVLLSMLALCLAPVGCKEGDSLEGGISPANASFIPEERDESVVDNYVSLRTNSIDGGTIVLDIVVTDVADPVMAIAMKVTYGSSFAKFIGCRDDQDMLPLGPCYFPGAEPSPGEVFIGRSTTSDNAMPVSGSHVIARLEFLVFGEGTSDLQIVAPNLGGGDATALLDDENQIIFVHWYSGALVGTSTLP